MNKNRFRQIKLLTTIVVFSFITSCALYNETTEQTIQTEPSEERKSKPQEEPGICFAKCLVENQYETVTEWREVVCSDDLSPELIGAIKKSLIENGFDIDPEYNDEKYLSPDEKIELENYQRENGLPIGQLELETLKKLEIPSHLYPNLRNLKPKSLKE